MLTRIVILGGGPAGYEAALVAAARGPEVAQVTVVDSDGIGGAAVLCDCVPSKTFIASTGLRTELRRAARLGFDIHLDDAKICLAEIHQRIKMLATEQSVDITAQLLSMGVELIAGRGELVDAAPGLARHRVKVTVRDGSSTIRDADVVLIATGASPRISPSAPPDGERILTWRQLYDLDSLPGHPRGWLRGDRHRIRQRLYRTGCDRNGGRQPRPGVAIRGCRRRVGAGGVVCRTRGPTGQKRPR